MNEATSENKIKDQIGSKMAKVIMGLIKDRKSIVGRGFNPHATFFLGDTCILLGLNEIIIGNTKYSLK